MDVVSSYVPSLLPTFEVVTSLKGEHLKGGHLKIRFRGDFSYKILKSIVGALLKAINSTGKSCLDRESAVSLDSNACRRMLLK